jgi:glucose-1-phosphate cytidylyltransferase
MKAVILAGGLGTRISEETKSKPKPMIKIGNKPILWHIMKCYAAYGINEFIICCGYKGNIIKDYFKENKTPWELKLVNTGLKTMTGGRLKKVEKYLDNDTFCFTYGDTLNDLNIKKLIAFHKSKKKLATVTACNPPEKYGVLKLQKDKVSEFKEKPKRKKEWVNGGFFVLEPNVFDHIKDDKTIWEKDPMKKLVRMNQLVAYRHNGFYQPMDTMNDKKKLDKMWKEKNASWKVWK